MTTVAREPVIGDAFGRVLTRCWQAGVRPGVAFEVVERDDGHVGVGDAARYFAGPDEWSPAERWACQQVIGRVLDVGCGAGRHAVALAEAGCEVFGVDPSSGAVAVACARGVSAVQASVGDLPANLGVFDTVVLLGNNLGLLNSREEAPAVLQRLAAVTRPGSRLIGSGLDPYVTETKEHHAYHIWNRERGRLPGQVRIRVRDGLIATEWFDYLLVSESELAEVVEGSPWMLHSIQRDGANYAARLDRR